MVRQLAEELCIIKLTAIVKENKGDLNADFCIDCICSIFSIDVVMREFRCTIFDIDGVLANVDHLLAHPYVRSWDDYYSKIDLAAPIHEGLSLLSKALLDSCPVIITARNIDCADLTRNWMKCYVKGSDKIDMHFRKRFDFRPDIEIKKEMIKKFSVQEVETIYEDKKSILDMYEDLGYNVSRQFERTKPWIEPIFKRRKDEKQTQA